MDDSFLKAMLSLLCTLINCVKYVCENIFSWKDEHIKQYDKLHNMQIQNKFPFIFEKFH